jgi:hypothetical protein
MPPPLRRPISRSFALLPREHCLGAHLRAAIDDIQAELLQQLSEVDTEVQALVARRQDIVADLLRCRDARGRVGYRRRGRVPLPADVDAIPEGTTPVCGRELREAIATVLRGVDRPVNISEIHRMLLARGLTTEGRASKAISDALRTEVVAGRLTRLERGLYGPPPP